MSSTNGNSIRETLDKLFSSKTRKLCFEAQETINVLHRRFSYNEKKVCTEWNVLDPKVAGWLLNPDHPPITFKHVIMPYPDLNQHENTDICSDLSLLGPAMLHIYQRLKQQELWQMFVKIEMPLVPILAVMETRSIVVDTEDMLKMSNLIKKKLAKLEQKAYEVAGQPFNMNSHPQLRVILFEKLQLDLHLPKNKVSKTTTQGNKSTSEAVLTQLSEVHPLPKIIIEHRQLQKLKSTYIDGMMVFVSNNELSTHWDQIAAATGRLTSTNPNIQSIPKQLIEVTDAEDNYIVGKDAVVSQLNARSPFQSHEGFSLLAADFKQIEFRILAHLSGDEPLIKMFNNKNSMDIFLELTSKWLGKSYESVTPDERENTKRIVYSVMYGVGKDRLSEYLKTSPEEAKGIMQSFLLTFPGVNTFSKTCIEQAQKQRYQSTILKRRRYLPNINHARHQLKAQTERQAVNFCVQGSAADLCKVAMIQVEHRLRISETLNGRLLFQIHDELLLEVPDSQIMETAELVKLVMESSEGLCGDIVQLKVPLQVTISAGKSWGELKELGF